MNRTALTVGGFTQPQSAKTLIELPSSLEKGLTQRILWMFPQPCFSDIEKLEIVNKDFEDHIIQRLSSVYKDNDEVFMLNLPLECEVYFKKHNLLQKQLRHLSVLDQLLSGLLSKAKGQILRVAALLHIFFETESLTINLSSVPSTISEQAIRAAIDFVDVSCQHTAYIAGRGEIEEEINHILTDIPDRPPEGAANASYCLTLPGKSLNLSNLLAQKKFRGRGNKEGALAAFKLLEEEGLGNLISKSSDRGARETYVFQKADVPECDIEAFAMKLVKFGVTLPQYVKSCELCAGGSLKNKTPPTTPTRRSPRKLPRLE